MATTSFFRRRPSSPASIPGLAPRIRSVRQWASAALGVQTAGAVFVPIYPASTAEQVAYILEHAEIKHVFVDGREQIARLERARQMVPLAPEVIALAGAAWSADAPITDEALPQFTDPGSPQP